MLAFTVCTRTHTSRYLQHVLAANAVGTLKVLLGVWVKTTGLRPHDPACRGKSHHHGLGGDPPSHTASPSGQSNHRSACRGFASLFPWCAFPSSTRFRGFALMSPKVYVRFLALSAFAAVPPESVLDLPAPSPAPLIFFLSPVLKSVSYQPPPDRRKDGALTCFFSAGLSHVGQSVSGASASF